MDGYTSAQIRAAEAPLLEAGVPLMARASRALADVAEAQAGDPPAGVLALAGPGNNGGDALYAAAALAEAGYRVAALPLAANLHSGGLEAALGAGVVLAAPPGATTEVLVSAARREVAAAAVVIDGILGTGSAGRAALREPAREVVQAFLDADLTRLGVRVVAADIPSGLDPDNGEVPGGVLLPPDVTVTFGARKAGLLRGEGPRVAGRVVVADIGLGPSLEGMAPAVVSRS